MKFAQKLSIRNNFEPAEFSKGIWNPEMHSWRDVVEDYLYISKKRINSKFSMLKLQMNILQDIVSNIKTIDGYKELQRHPNHNEIEGNLSEIEYEDQKIYINSHIYSHTMINKALREIMDGIVWKYFEYNRGVLYMLADKEPIETIRPDQGTINNLYEFTDIFLKKDAIAIYNDITNFLRVGDITQINEDGTIEIIEVKAKEKRGKRITRQKERMTELVEFFNTGFTNYDGKKLKILNSGIKQITYLGLLRDAIKRARHRGFESLLIGNYCLVEIIDFSKSNEFAKIKDYLESKHKSIRQQWTKNNDFVHPLLFTDKMNYAKNCAPFSIYPFDIETCTDITMGKIMIVVRFNISELIRIFSKAGWNTVDALIHKSEDEINAINKKDSKDISLIIVRKGPLTLDVPPSMIARMQYELLSPTSVIAEFEEMLKRGPQDEYDMSLTNYLDEQRIWS